MTVRLQNISKSYGKTSVIQDISLDVQDGEFLCFLGPSGCGKTTLLRIIAGFEAVNAGRLFHKNHDITHLVPGARNFSMVFQGYTLFPHMTVAQNVAYGLECRKFTKGEVKNRSKEMLDLVRLADFGERFPSQLSGGQQQRVAIARALAVKPDVLLMDEAFSALDAKVRVELRSELRAMQKALGVTTIMVTHDQEEAMELADRIVVLNKGCIEQISTPEELYYHPSNAFVADFIGEMNYIHFHHQTPGQLNFSGQTYALASAHIENKATLAIRPEDIEIVTTDGFNTFDVVVREISFLGAFTRIIAKLGNEQQLLLKVSHKQRLTIESGDHLKVHLPAELIQSFSLAH